MIVFCIMPLYLDFKCKRAVFIKQHSLTRGTSWFSIIAADIPVYIRYDTTPDFSYSNIKTNIKTFLYQNSFFKKSLILKSNIKTTEGI